ncbi:hypothetical protein KIN20_012803 [Parelaphostrongylus tenuis]|uniref:Uncharacterized protein n=1 Tax=Parelaphostrongylus tenuis TaxID=148309 RepID=A0AAD5N1E8_PARTN|nr:hypothetical protein KIN20_012803 [Parelaphostrongylus tenuis]
MGHVPLFYLELLGLAARHETINNKYCCERLNRCNREFRVDLTAIPSASRHYKAGCRQIDNEKFTELDWELVDHSPYRHPSSTVT